MKRIIIFSLLVAAFFSVKAQYHLLYFSDDSISKMQYDATDFYVRNKCDESIKVYRKLAAIDSLKKSSIYNIGLNYSRMKQPDSAIYYFKNAIELGYDSLFIFDRIVSMFEVKMENYEKAYSVLTEMIGYWPMNSELFKKRAGIWLSWKKNSDGYIKDMQKAADLGDVQAKESIEYQRRAIENYYKKNNVK
jgi:tetratricopeptide (TPR) repeat protein